MVLDLFQRDFGTTRVASADAEFDLEEMPVFVAIVKRDQLAGALGYRLTEDALQMLALATDPMWQRSGVGGHLVDEAERVATEQGRRRAWLTTSNDNLPALYFYQRHGYHITQVTPGKLVPRSEGRPGFAGIAVRDEIRLEKALDAASVRSTD